MPKRTDCKPSLMSLFEQPPPLPIIRWNHYFPIYEQYFSKLRDSPIRMLEIGVQGGGSQWMWKQYFHPDSIIFGLDINPECAKLAEVTGTHIITGDQASPDDLNLINAMYGPFDIIIDDGGHTNEQQITSFGALYDRMTPNGIYLVEDTHTAVWGDEFRVPGLPDFMDFSAAKALELMEWTGDRRNFNKLLSHDYRDLDDAAGTFCRSTRAIHFYDSIVVFERERRHHAPRQTEYK